MATLVHTQPESIISRAHPKVLRCFDIMPIVIAIMVGRLWSAGRPSKKDRFYLSCFVEITCIIILSVMNVDLKKVDSVKQTQITRAVNHHICLKI
jgi:hypothetical protein